MIARPFRSDNEEVNQLIDWMIRNFELKSDSARTLLREVDRLGGSVGKMASGEMRYRQYKDYLGDYLQLIIVKDGKMYPMPAVKANNGALRYLENATVYDDMRIPGLSVVVGSAAPDLGTFLAAGNLKAYLFAGTGVVVEEVHFAVQIPHGWKEGSVLYPHVHWTPTTADAGNVHWQMEYTFANVNDAFPAVTTISGTDAAATTAWTHQIDPLTSIDGKDKKLSAMFVGRLFRDPAHASDTYAFDAALLEIDIHYEIDAPGSDAFYVK